MKHALLLTLILTVLAVLAPVTTAQAQNPNWQKLIVKKWKLVDVYTPEMDTMSAATKKEIVRLMSSVTMEFKSNGTCKSSMTGLGKSVAHWKIIGDTLITAEQSGDTTRVGIIELTSKKLVLGMTEGTAITKLTLKPAK